VRVNLHVVVEANAVRERVDGAVRHPDAGAALLIVHAVLAKHAAGLGVGAGRGDGRDVAPHRVGAHDFFALDLEEDIRIASGGLLDEAVLGDALAAGIEDLGPARVTRTVRIDRGVNVVGALALGNATRRIQRQLVDDLAFDARPHAALVVTRDRAANDRRTQAFHFEVFVIGGDRATLTPHEVRRDKRRLAGKLDRLAGHDRDEDVPFVAHVEVDLRRRAIGRAGGGALAADLDARLAGNPVVDQRAELKVIAAGVRVGDGLDREDLFDARDAETLFGLHVPAVHDRRLARARDRGVRRTHPDFFVRILRRGARADCFPALGGFAVAVTMNVDVLFAFGESALRAVDAVVQVAFFLEALAELAHEAGAQRIVRTHPFKTRLQRGDVLLDLAEAGLEALALNAHDLGLALSTDRLDEVAVRIEHDHAAELVHFIEDRHVVVHRAGAADRGLGVILAEIDLNLDEFAGFRVVVGEEVFAAQRILDAGDRSVVIRAARVVERERIAARDEIGHDLRFLRGRRVARVCAGFDDG